MLRIFIFCHMMIYVRCFSADDNTEENCTDFEGLNILHGLLYVPGPDVCSLCVCYHGSPMWCKTIFCPGPPTRCDNYVNGVYCCDFICLDNPPKPITKRRSRSNAGSIHTANLSASNWFLLATLTYMLFNSLIIQIRTQS